MLIVAYYERWSGRLAARQHWNAAPHFTPAIAADTPPQQSPYPYLFKAYARQPQFGFSRSNDQTVAPEAIWRATSAWKAWRPQPTLGWAAPTEQDANLNVFPVAWASVRQWQRWRPQPTLGQFIAGDQPIIYPDTPTHVGLRPFLFKGYGREPWLGWADRADSPPPVIPAPEPTRSLPLHPYLFRRYRPQPSLGRSWAWDSSAAPTTPAPTTVRRNAALVHLLLYHRQQSHRGHGWNR